MAGNGARKGVCKPGFANIYTPCHAICLLAMCDAIRTANVDGPGLLFSVGSRLFGYGGKGGFISQRAAAEHSSET